jgi:hypothetical protein
MKVKVTKRILLTMLVILALFSLAIVTIHMLSHEALDINVLYGLTISSSLCALAYIGVGRMKEKN